MKKILSSILLVAIAPSLAILSSCAGPEVRAERRDDRGDRTSTRIEERGERRDTRLDDRADRRDDRAYERR